MDIGGNFRIGEKGKEEVEKRGWERSGEGNGGGRWEGSERAVRGQWEGQWVGRGGGFL